MSEETSQFYVLFKLTILFSMKHSQKITSKKSVNSKKLSPFRCDIVSQLGAGFVTHVKAVVEMVTDLRCIVSTAGLGICDKVVTAVV